MAGVMIVAWVFLFGSVAASAQTIVDSENRYSNVGTIMVWRVEESGKPVQLMAFGSGTLIRPRVMVTAGHVTAPAKAMGKLPPTIRMFASFSATDARNPATWIPVTAQATHPSMPHCPPPAGCDPTDDVLVAPLAPGIADVGLVFLERAPANIKPAVLAAAGTLRDPKALAQRSSDTALRRRQTRVSRWTHGHGTASGASGPRPCEGSSMKRGDSGRSPATFVSGIQAVAFS